MNKVVLSIVAGFFASIVLFVFLVRFIPKRARPLNTARLSPTFDGLRRFGKAGSYVEISNWSLRDRFLFLKRLDERNETWIDLLIRSPNLDERVRSSLCNELSTMRSTWDIRFNDAGADRFEARAEVRGAGVDDPAALEGLVRLIVRSLNRPQDTKYRAEFLGPKDFEAVDEYFGFKDAEVSHRDDDEKSGRN